MAKRIVVGAAAVVALLTAGTGVAEAGTLTVEVLSNRANLISGGDALVAVKLPRSVKPASVKMTLNSSDVTNQFALRQNGSYEGLLSGLQLGANVLRAEAPGSTAGQATIVDHLNGGPVFSGPQVEPWVCENPDATDAQCDAPTTYAYYFMPAVDQSAAAPGRWTTSLPCSSRTVVFVPAALTTARRPRDDHRARAPGSENRRCPVVS